MHGAYLHVSLRLYGVYNNFTYLYEYDMGLHCKAFHAQLVVSRSLQKAHNARAHALYPKVLSSSDVISYSDSVLQAGQILLFSL